MPRQKRKKRKRNKNRVNRWLRWLGAILVVTGLSAVGWVSWRAGQSSDWRYVVPRDISEVLPESFQAETSSPAVAAEVPAEIELPPIEPVPPPPSALPPPLVVPSPVPDPSPRPVEDAADLPDWQQILWTQIGLARRGISCGSLDGVMGSQTRAAIRVFQNMEGLPVNGELDELTRERLTIAEPVLTNHIVSHLNLARLLPIGKTWLAKSEQSRLDYETVLELVSEQHYSNPKLIRRLNPDVDWGHVYPGLILNVPRVHYPPVEEKALFARIYLSRRMLQAFDAKSNLVAHFPCSIARRVEKRPVGELRVAVLIPDPNYTFDPSVFPESAEGRALGRKLVVQPGPNNPVGTVWIGLDKARYGIHGTPVPELVGRTESHGCFRLANWNAEYLLSLAWVGMPVYVEP